MTKPTDILYPVPDQRVYKMYKHSDGTKDIQINWQEYLESSESIASQVITASGISKDSDSSSGQVSTIFVSGGDPKSNSYLDITITTDNATARVFKIRVHFYFENATKYYDSRYYY